MSKLSCQVAELIEKGEEETAYEKYVADGLEIDGFHRERPLVPMSQVRLFPVSELAKLDPTFSENYLPNATKLANIKWT